MCQEDLSNNMTDNTVMYLLLAECAMRESAKVLRYKYENA